MNKFNLLTNASNRFFSGLGVDRVTSSYITAEKTMDINISNRALVTRELLEECVEFFTKCTEVEKVTISQGDVYLVKENTLMI